MENRFGIKDFFLFALLVIVVAMIGLAMYQFDRQWKVVQTIQTDNRQLADDINRLQRKIESGIWSGVDRSDRAGCGCASANMSRAALRGEA